MGRDSKKSGRNNAYMTLGSGEVLRADPTAIEQLRRSGEITHKAAWLLYEAVKLMPLPQQPVAPEASAQQAYEPVTATDHEVGQLATTTALAEAMTADAQVFLASPEGQAMAEEVRASAGVYTNA